MQDASSELPPLVLPTNFLTNLKSLSQDEFTSMLSRRQVSSFRYFASNYRMIEFILIDVINPHF